MDCAILAQKIARVKNNPDELSFIGKKVGSNYLFLDGLLKADRKYEFAALTANDGVAGAAPTKSSIACMVEPVGIEPTTFRTSNERSTTELWLHAGNYTFFKPTLQLIKSRSS